MTIIDIINTLILILYLWYKIENNFNVIHKLGDFEINNYNAQISNFF